MARLRYNNQGGLLGADPGSGGTTLTFIVAPDFATIVGPDYIPIALDPGLSTFEIVHMTAYTAGATTGTITRAAEDGTLWPAVAHPIAVGPPPTGTWTVAPTVADMGVSGIPVGIYVPQGASGGLVWDPLANGIKADNSTDDTAAWNALFVTVEAANGGTIQCPPQNASGGVFHSICLGVLTPMPYGTTCPGIRITGAGPSYANMAGGVVGPSIIDLRYAGNANPAKIDIRGLGSFEMDHVSLVSGGTDDYPFFQTTNCAPKLHDLYVSGHPANAGITCVQDAFILGGTSATPGGGPTAPFQGYGGFVKDNFFSQIRRATLGQTACNGVPVRNNTIAGTCGTNLAGGVPFEWVGTASVPCSGNILADNTIEATNYVYGSAWTYGSVNQIANNGIWDVTGMTVAGHRFNVGSSGNTVIDGSHSGVTAISEYSTVLHTNVVISAIDGEAVLAFGLQPPSSATWIALAGSYSNGWADNNDGEIPGRYRRTISGMVVVEGVLDATGASAGTAFTLPAGFRPSANSIYVPIVVYSSAAYVVGAIYILATGAVSITLINGITPPTTKAYMNFTFYADA